MIVNRQPDYANEIQSASDLRAALSAVFEDLKNGRISVAEAQLRKRTLSAIERKAAAALRDAEQRGAVPDVPFYRSRPLRDATE